MVSYEVPKPPLKFFERMRESARLAAAFMKGDRTTINDITAATVFSPLQPLQPGVPQIVGRTYDYQPGVNVQFQPRGYGSGRIPFPTLRAASRNCEILRLIIETIKDQICSFGWQIVPKEDIEIDPDDARILTLTEFFKSPDKVHTSEQWFRMLLEEFLVTDATSIYRVKDRVGAPYAFEIIDGGTIKVLIDADGRRPIAPDPAYQQVIKGSPRANYTTDELLYMPRTLLSYDPTYGLSMVEQILITIQTSINRQKYQLAYFTEGSLPDAYASMPEGMSVDSIQAFENRFNEILSGNAGQRRQVPFLPFGAIIAALKQPPLKDEFDEWITRIICFAGGIAPTAFIRQMNRSTSETDQERAQQEGQAPKMQFLKVIMDSLIADFGPEYANNFEFAWRESKNIDPKEQADVLKELVSAGLKTLNEGRADLGLDPVQGGDLPMVLTASGYVPLDSFEQQQAANEAARTASLNAAPNENDPKSKPASKSAYSRLGKAGGHLKPLPFPRAATRTAVKNLAATITPILKKTGLDVANHVRRSHFGKMAKDDNQKIDDFVAALSLDDLNALIEGTPAEIAKVMNESGQHVIVQLGGEHRSDLVNQVSQRAIDYARERGAEMVGKRWVDGELVDSPNAEWRIDEATRDEIKNIISQGLEDNIGTDAIADNIEESTAFSPERAQLIAETEIGHANSNGTLESARSARDDLGLILKKLWLVDEDPCPVCVENGDAGALDLDDEFPSGDDAPLAHPNCECALNIEVIDEGDISSNSADN